MYDPETRDNIIELYMNGFSSGDISEQTGVSPRTIQYIIKEYKSKLKTKAIEANIKHRVLVIPDLHLPGSFIKYINWLKDVYDEYECDTVVFLGDMFDTHTISKHTREPDSDGTLTEYHKAIEIAKEYYKAFPEAYYCLGNHCSRIIRQAKELGIPQEFLKDFRDLYHIPEGWKIDNSFIIDDVLYTHGTEYSNRGAITTVPSITHHSTVLGHVHSSFGVFYTNCGFDQLFCMYCGCLIDPDSYIFRYGKSSKFKPVLGCGVVFSSNEAYTIPYKEK